MKPRAPTVLERFGIVAALSLGPVVATSFARFAYALVLPAMRAELGLNYAQAGALNTANALGYLAGALLCARYVARLGNRILFRAGLVVTVAALLGAGTTDSFAGQLACRAVAGVSGALVYICGAVLASNVFPGRSGRSALAIGVYFAGAGAGIVLSGIGIPLLLALAGEDAWRDAWLLTGCASVLLAAIAVRGARAVEEPPRAVRGEAWPMASFAPALASYALFGAGYIAYMTFVVASMRSHGASTLEVALTWGTLGIATMLAPLAWRIPRARWHASKTLAASAAVIGMGAAIPLVDASPVAMLSSALLFGGAMFTVPTAITDLVKTSLPRAAWGSAVAVFTVSFAAGQVIGPVLTGWLADEFASLDASLAASVAILLAAGAMALLQRERLAAHAATALRAVD